MHRHSPVVAKLTVCAAVGAYILLALAIPLGCPIETLTSLPCPGCGMTRAWLSMLRLAPAEAFSHHFMFWSVPILLVSFFKDGRLFESRALNRAVHIAILVGFLIQWGLRLGGRLF